MIFELIFYTLSSLLIIYSIHSLYNYLKNTYTTKKTKDLVIFNLNKYQEIFENGKIKKNENDVSLQEFNDIDFITNHEKDILQKSLLELIKVEV